MKLLLLDRPADKEIVGKREVEFFGPWAQPIDLSEDLSRPTFEPYPAPECLYSVSLRVMNVAGDILESLAKLLAGLTGVNKGKRFWRVFLGHYAITLVGIVEDIKIRHLALPEKDYILALPSNHYIKDYIPYSWNDTERYLFSGYFRQHAMGLYLKDYYENHEFLKYLEVPERIIAKRIEELYVKAFQNGYRGLFKKAGSFLNDHLWPMDKVRGLCSNTYSLTWDIYNLENFNYKKLKTAILPEQYLPSINSLPAFQVDNKKRQRLKNSLPYPYGELLSLSLPLVTLEGLAYLINLIDRLKYRYNFNRIERIYTYGQAFSNEAVKSAFLALLADEGKEIVSIQHGGGAGYFAHSGMFRDRVIADKYISWGHGYSNFTGLADTNSTKALPSIYLSKLKQKNFKKNKRIKWDVLFVVLEEGRYIKWLYSPIFPDMAYDYFRREKVLFDYFCIRKRTAVKVYPVTHGWGQFDWVKSRYSQAKLLKTGRFVDYALQSNLVIVDYNSTAFLEMLAMKRPFLTTWNRRWFRGGKLFEEFIDKLGDVGIFYEQPEALIRSYNEVISQDLNSWWNESKRQSVLEEMANNFAMTSDIVYEEWANEFARNELH